MPGEEHGIPLKIFRNAPGPVVPLLEGVGFEVPEFTEVTHTSAECTDGKPRVYNADGAHVLRNGAEKVLAVVVERRHKREEDRFWTWPVYHATGRSNAARKYLEDLISVETYEWQSDFARKYVGIGREEGMEQGIANSVILFLEERGLAVSDDVRTRIESCDDLDTLNSWVRKAVRVARAGDLFD